MSIAPQRIVFINFFMTFVHSPSWYLYSSITGIISLQTSYAKDSLFIHSQKSLNEVGHKLPTFF